MTTPDTMFKRIVDDASRPDPYPLYAELRRTPVARQEDGTYLVSTYHEIVALLHDPRLSSDPHNREDAPPDLSAEAGLAPAFIRMDPPDHDRLRAQTMRLFGPPHNPARVYGMRDELTRISTGLIDGFAVRYDGGERIDIVDEFAYPFPVTVICALMGVPRDDEHLFKEWADALIQTLDPRLDPGLQRQAMTEMGQYMAALIGRHRQDPGDDMLSGMITEGLLPPETLVTTAIMLFIAGHETTVNLITNGMLTLLRRPEVLDRLRREPELMPGAVEELLRYEPPVHMLSPRGALADIEVAGVTIPKGASVVLVLASGNRDPKRFRDPDVFDPAREDNQHFGFGSGIHSCFGAPLARLETQIALTGLIRRLRDPRLVADPPPYRSNPRLRGPEHLFIEHG
ncbi:cytochrome P450 [Microtetraspora glauca]|uniref:Cytochrome P450 n=1 Tax=Microtetraspora glauca TaxID=1996 RepID=A0ABV3GI98_MICGL